MRPVPGIRFSARSFSFVMALMMACLPNWILAFVFLSYASSKNNVATPLGSEWRRGLVPWCIATTRCGLHQASMMHRQVLRWFRQSARWQTVLQYVAVWHPWQCHTRPWVPQRQHVASIRTRVTSTGPSATPKADASVSRTPSSRTSTSRVISRIEIERAIFSLRLRSWTVHSDATSTEHTYPLSIDTRTVSTNTSSTLLSSAAIARQQRCCLFFLRDDDFCLTCSCCECFLYCLACAP